jgi:hypothetical protein
MINAKLRMATTCRRTLCVCDPLPPGFAKNLLDVADNMQRAIDAANKMPAEQLESNVPLKSMLEGIVMTQGQMQAAFQKHGIVKVTMAMISRFPFCITLFLLDAWMLTLTAKSRWREIKPQPPRSHCRGGRRQQGAGHRGTSFQRRLPHQGTLVASRRGQYLQERVNPLFILSYR